MRRLEMWDRCVVLILLFPCVLCDDCVTFDFENDFNVSFSNEIGVCLGRLMWNVGRYENLPIDSPDEGSTKFVYPNEELSCASSFTFHMTTSGILEVNLFMEPSSGTDQVTILANQIVPGGNDAVVGNAWIIARDDSFVSGWITATITISGFGSFDGYITILGMAARDSIVLVDSFRYISPIINEEDCVIYEKPTTTKTTQTVEIVSTDTESSASTTDITTPPYTTPPYTIITTIFNPEMTAKTTAYPEITDSLSTSETEDIGIGTEQTYSTVDTTTDIDKILTTERPVVNPDNIFWNACTITMVIFLSIIILVLTAVIWYYIGRRRGRRESQINLPYFEDYPRPYIIPRVVKIQRNSSTTNRLSSMTRLE